MKPQEKSITLALPVSGLEEWIQSRITEAIEEATNKGIRPKEYVSQKELAQRIGLSIPTVIDLRKKGIIAGVNIGNK